MLPRPKAFLASQGGEGVVKRRAGGNRRCKTLFFYTSTVGNMGTGRLSVSRENGAVGYSGLAIYGEVKAFLKSSCTTNCVYQPRIYNEFTGRHFDCYSRIYDCLGLICVHIRVKIKVLTVLSGELFFPPRKYQK